MTAGPDSSSPATYTAEELETMTIAQIKALASDRGYTITASKKADIIAEFIAQQN